ncbi:MAG: TatD family hydrolase [Candidatus Berkelbacteria bacterium]|nr:TatD family hydrolase [Candidatus Berkelbacteria bacterium]
MFIDTHSHLNFKQFDEDLDKVIERACAKGVNRMIVVGSDIHNSKKAIEMANKNNHLFATVGIHPIHIRGSFGMFKNDGLPPSIWTEDYESQNSVGKTVCTKEIKDLLESPRVVAMGEIGLDYHSENRRKINKGIQRSALSGLIDVAKEEKLPIIFHCRDAIEDFFNTLKSKKSQTKGVIHCFQGDVVDAKRAFDLGLLISYTGMITMRADYDEVIRYAPLENIMIETDCPFLTPEPHRGERNEPAYVVEVARRIAEIKDVPYFRVAEETTKNAIKLFGLDKF